MVTPLLAYKAVQRKLYIQKTAFWEHLRIRSKKKKITWLTVRRSRLRTDTAGFRGKHFKWAFQIRKSISLWDPYQWQMTRGNLFITVHVRGSLQREQLHWFSIHSAWKGKKKRRFKNKNKTRFLAAVLKILLHSWLVTGSTAGGLPSPTVQLSSLSLRRASARRRFGLSDSDLIAGLCTSVLSFERSLLVLRLSLMTSHNSDSFRVPSTAPGK